MCVHLWRAELCKFRYYLANGNAHIRFEWQRLTFGGSHHRVIVVMMMLTIHRSTSPVFMKVVIDRLRKVFRYAFNRLKVSKICPRDGLG